MTLSRKQAIQKRMNQLTQIAKVQAAVLVMYPGPDSEEYRYQSKDVNPEIWQPISSICHRFKANGISELLNEPVVCSGQKLHLLGANYGNPSQSSLLIAATLPMPDAFDISSMRNALEKVALACLREADSIRWK